jgi:hypothetical protein
MTASPPETRGTPALGSKDPLPPARSCHDREGPLDAAREQTEGLSPAAHRSMGSCSHEQPRGNSCNCPRRPCLFMKGAVRRTLPAVRPPREHETSRASGARRQDGGRLPPRCGQSGPILATLRIAHCGHVTLPHSSADRKQNLVLLNGRGRNFKVNVLGPVWFQEPRRHPNDHRQIMRHNLDSCGAGINGSDVQVEPPLQWQAHSTHPIDPGSLVRAPKIHQGYVEFIPRLHQHRCDVAVSLLVCAQRQTIMVRDLLVSPKEIQVLADCRLH